MMFGQSEDDGDEYENPGESPSPSPDLSGLLPASLPSVATAASPLSDQVLPASVSSFSDETEMAESTLFGRNNRSRTQEHSVYLQQAPLVFVESPTEQLICSMCDQVYIDPVIAACGDTFCRRCIQRKINEPCPHDSTPLKVLVPNKIVWDQASQLKIHCRHGLRATASDTGWEPDPDGCPEQILFGNRREHEDECGFARVHCPNSHSCPPMLKKNLQHHLRVCANLHCPNSKLGCPFVGKGEELTLHSEKCAFSGVSGYLLELSEEMKSVRARLKQSEEKNEFLTNMLAQVTDRLDRMERSLEHKIDTARKDISLSFRDQVQNLQDEINTFSRGWDPQQAFRCRGTFVGHAGPVWCLCVYQDLLFSGSSDKTIKVWDLSTNYRCVKTLEAHQGIVLALCVFGGKLFSGSQDNSIIVWNLESFQMMTTIQAHESPVCTLACARNMLFSGSLRVIKVWNAETFELVREITGLTAWVRALVATHTFLYCGSNRNVTVWDLDTFECVRSLDTMIGSVYSIAVTQHHVLCGTNENSIHVWGAGSSTQEGTLMGHSGTVFALAALHTATGIKAFSASFDRAIRVWSMDNMICTQTLLRHQGSVTSLVISKGRVFSGSVDMTIKVWQ